MKRVTTHEAKTHLSRLLGEVEAGEEVVILRGSTPAARLVPIAEVARRRPRVGAITSDPVVVSDDAFAALGDEDLAEWGL